MSLLVNLGMIAMVLTFLLGILSAFPGRSDATTTAQVQQVEAASDEFSIDLVEVVGGLLGGSYMSVIDDVSSYQTDPNFERAESRRQEFSEYSDVLVGEFEGLVDELTSELDDLQTDQAELEASLEATPTPSPTPTP